MRLPSLLIGLWAFVGSTSAFPSEAHGDLKHHVLGVFLGVSDERGGEDNTTYGLEYEYRFTQKWAAGIVLEKTEDAHHHDGVSVALASVYLHPAGGWVLGAGVGREKIHGDHRGDETLYRLKAAYDFHLGGIGVAPGVAMDRVDGENILVYGVALSVTF